ncbi:RNA processing-related protein [Wallemia mellicola]|uniref:RNA processing-related protein n=1 Tax=Wallemia mellicola TaxID=1708541 RepID=A0AB74KHQ0_9BASI|nr:RNA processing-related protein [Wallemia mellicola]
MKDFDDLVNDDKYEMGTGQELARAELQATEDMFERRKVLRTLAVPTDDNKVRERLRAFGLPMTLFGERPEDRRSRLKSMIADMQEEAGEKAKIESEDESEEEEEFYTVGSQELLQTRRLLAEYSIPRAKRRIEKERDDWAKPLKSIVDARKRTFEYIKLWDIPNCNHQMTLRGHDGLVGGVDWHPQATLNQSKSSVNLASGSQDSTVALWSLEKDTPLATLKGHTHQVRRVAFHPSGRYLGSASFDETWRLWDVETQAELQLQEGHSKEVYALAFQDDGALVGSAGMDAIGRVWDLRTGRTAMVLDGHADKILALDFSPNGYQCATGSGDGKIMIWDLRALKSISTMPAHNISVGDLKFYRQPETVLNSRNDKQDVKMDESGDNEDMSPLVKEPYSHGLFLASAGFDGYTKLWSADDWICQRSIAENSKIMSVDVSRNGKHLATGEWSRSFKLFGTEL